MEELENYTESRYEPDLDYTDYPIELSVWLSDYWRDQEEKRNRQNQDGTMPLLGHDLCGDSGSGFDEDSFDLSLVRGKIKSRGLA